MEYDSTLKQLVAESAPRLLSVLVGGPVVEWLNIELPRASVARMDMLCQRADGCLVNIEFQSSNEPDMVVREALYYLETYRAKGKYPIPVVLYMGKEPMRMRDRIETEHLQFQMRLIDIRTIDGDDLAENGDLGDAIISILAGVRDRHVAVVRVLERIGKLKGNARKVAAQQLTLLAGLRGLEKDILKEARIRMPVTIDLMENEVIREIYERGTAEGKAAGKAEGERAILVRQLEKRFGTLPVPARTRIDQAGPEQLEQWLLRVLDASSIDDVLA